MTRYFIGLMAPLAVQQRLASFAHTIDATLPSRHPYTISWTAPADLHCTLLFVGPTEDEQHLEHEMRRLAAQLVPITVTVGGPTHWLGRNSLALSATGAEETGPRFVHELGHLSSDAQAEKRPFYGHVTLGRVRPVPAGAHDPFAGHGIESLSWEAHSVQLVKSRNNIGDTTRYQIVSHAQFGG